MTTLGGGTAISGGGTVERQTQVAERDVPAEFI